MVCTPPLYHWSRSSPTLSFVTTLLLFLETEEEVWPAPNSLTFNASEMASSPALLEDLPGFRNCRAARTSSAA